ncbi:Cytochrome P450 76M5 [Dichanthelium oligosanthes]|uniref:Cytochrome P450 76M5 n=1 Tax=Dichanthelium oligosanthes TaxID=888268 RepID=A0A1E5WL07_9POAL|nr:Cytochrome P450 76M5 [Dichanthelium oligosanthes]
MVLSMLLPYMVLALAAILLLRRKHKPRESSLPAAPPGPVGLPLIGNAFTFFGLLRHNPHRALARLAGTYGPIFSFRPGTTCAFVVLSSPAMAREALAEREAALAARFVPDSVRALGYGAGSMAFLPSSDPLWKQHRVTAGAFLTSSRGLTATRPVRNRHASRLAVRLRARSGRPVKVGEAVFGAANNVISNILFSEDVVDDDLAGVQGERPPPFERIVGVLFQEWAKPNVSDAFPFLAPLDLFGSRRRTSRNLAQLYELFHGLVDRRLASGENHGDMLDAVLLERHAKSQLTRSDIAKLFTDMFIGASETSNLTVEWATAHLLRHGDKMEKLRAEIAASLGSKDFVEEGDLGNLPYLHAVVKETLRLHPAVPVVTREVAADGVSLGGFPMATGTCILVNLWAIGRDPDVWPDQPEAFMPERFLGAGAALHFRGSDFAYRPFGAGRRMCPGLDFAARFVPLVLASMLHKIEWTLPEGMVPEDVDLSEHCTLVLKLAKPLIAVPVSTP